MNTLAWAALPVGAGMAIVLTALLVALAYSFRQRRRRLDAELLVAESHEQLALISSMSSFGFWSWDAATDKVWASRHTRTILALAEDEPLTGPTVLAAVHPEDRPALLNAINLTSRPNTMEIELRVIGKDREI